MHECPECGSVCDCDQEDLMHGSAPPDCDHDCQEDDDDDYPYEEEGYGHGV